MLNIFNKKPDLIKNSTILLKTPSCPTINFQELSKGIDSVHIDVLLSSHFTELTTSLIYTLLDERSSLRRRTIDKPSKLVREKLEEFRTSYESMLTAAIHQAKKTGKLESIQLFQVAIIKWLLNTIKYQNKKLMDELKTKALKGNQFELTDRISWINNNPNNISFMVTGDLFEHLSWVESGVAKNLRESLFGIPFTLPLELLFNPLLKSLDIVNPDVLMKHYILLLDNPDKPYNPATDSPYHFKNLDKIINKVLNEISRIYSPQILPNEENKDLSCAKGKITDMLVAWKNMPENMDSLFKLKETEKEKQEYKVGCLKILEQYLRQNEVILPIFAAYETEILYEHYAKLLEPKLIYQGLCNKVNLQDIGVTLEHKLKIRPLRRIDDKPLNIKELKTSQKRIASISKQSNHQILSKFIKDFVTYSRDFKSHQLMLNAMKKIHLLSTEEDLLLSRSNNLLYEFIEFDEYLDSAGLIRCHVILKADIRGSTTITAELEKRSLNPATLFSRNFFTPIDKLIKDFGAEKVFIEGDAVILSFMEYENRSEDWLSVARAVGLAKNLLAIVQTNNQFNNKHNLPELDLGIGICYLSEAPKFLHNDEQKIMISSAIGDADRLSSCSWKLRKKYGKDPKLLTNVMVFQPEPDDAFKRENERTTFRYNLNGVELHPDGFKKLQSEMALQKFTTRLPGEEYQTNFYAGSFHDTKGNQHQLVIREGRVKVWQEDCDDYALTKTLYYEVVTNKKILSIIQKWLEK